MTLRTLFPLVAVVTLAAAGCRLPAPVEQFEAWKNQALFGTPFPFGGGCCGACGPACDPACCDPCCGGAVSADCSDGCSSCAPGGTVVSPEAPYLPPAAAPGIQTSPGPLNSPSADSLQTAPGPETYQPSL